MVDKLGDSHDFRIHFIFELLLLCVNNDCKAPFILRCIAGEEGGRVWVGVRCCVGVSLRGCGERESRGVEEWRGDEGEEVREKLKTRGTARKIAFRRACEDAFSNILIILVPGRPPVPMVT